MIVVSARAVLAIQKLIQHRERLTAINQSVESNDDALPGFARLFHWKGRLARFLRENVSAAEADNLAKTGRKEGLANAYWLHAEVKLYDAILVTIIEALEDDPESVFENEPQRDFDTPKSKVARVRFKHDVFISYSSLDQEQATEIHKSLKTAGRKAFLSVKDLVPGQDFAEAIRTQLVGSRELWFIVSPNSLKSEWVLTEWGAAWALNKKIVPILHQCSPAVLPERLRRLQTIDFYKYQELIAKTFGSPLKKRR